MDLISIIVPVYNTENYISECIESILKQSYENFELILIDDGSEDNSGVICENYSYKDSRIKVFHTPNGGVSKARNIGLDNAIGDYVSFVDSDDILEKDYLNNLYKYLIKCNCTVARSNQKFNGKIKKFSEFYDEDGIRIVDRTNITSIQAFSYIHCFLYKKDLLNDIRFNDNLTYSETTMFNFIVYHFNENWKMVLIDVDDYIYRLRNSSTAHNLTIDHAFSKMEVADTMLKYSEEYNEILKKSVNKYRTRSYFFSLSILVNSKEKKKYKNEIKRIKKVLRLYRRKGYKPDDWKRNLVDILYLYNGGFIINFFTWIRKSVKGI